MDKQPNPSNQSTKPNKTKQNKTKQNKTKTKQRNNQTKQIKPIPWNGFLEKQIVTLLIKKFPAFYGTRKFISVFIRARHLSRS
jgi:hypothetical protein